MSFQAMAKAVSIKTEKASEKLVLMMLANYCDENDQAYPSYNRLAADCCMSERAVQMAISKLKKLGVVTTQKRYLADGRSTSNLYILNLDNAEKVTKSKNTGGAKSAPPKPPVNTGGAKSAPPKPPVNTGGAKSAGYGADSAPMGAQFANEPINEPITSSNKPAEPVFDFDLVLAWILIEIEKGFFELSGIDKTFIQAKLEEYVSKYSKPGKADALSYVDIAMRQRHGIERRSAKTSMSRDKLNNSVNRQLEAQAAVIDQHTRNMKPKTIDEKLNDRSWAEGIDI